uniref:Uncharacterized protein n=1 Tax=Chromera velia CCMP2878 TaxID=1169474 RepID=A0A0G4HRY2_9ALVE|eukprot:Cvel_30783.t1-p1 / transcript=Cvel_30783.t1 / gene=Cvel_30783 / organism=Chromera_velia_CCMP2878 / gene_product=hypothetical protein / transcript_product=hypothetical protein / location=Cvel_scaffold4450:8394-9439(+) / protein_length=102 / sequence_SO=supercontig / SO=protein_coding / is_pseudo=false
MLDDETQQTTGRGLTATLLGGASVGTISGVLPMSEQEKFGRIVFRVSRGNSYVTFAPVEPVIGDEPKSLAVSQLGVLEGELNGKRGPKFRHECEASFCAFVI